MCIKVIMWNWLLSMTDQRFNLQDTNVVIKVQHPSHVGGCHDHPSWDRTSHRHSHNIKDIVSYSSYNKQVLNGDNVLYYSNNN